ncbi:MAG: heavy metal-associated domain-containing protein [Bacteroidota bacterium]
MEKEVIQIENLKCGGCANSIRKNLEKLSAVSEVTIDLEKSEVQVSTDSDVKRETIIAALAKLGYPESGQGTAIQKVKSYVSCAVGRLSN